MDVASVGAASIAFHSQNLQNSIGVAMMKKAMDNEEASAAALVDTIAQIPAPGQMLDVRA